MKSPVVHYSQQAWPIAPAGRQMAAAATIACGVPRAVDRHARYHASAFWAQVTCRRCWLTHNQALGKIGS